MAQAGSRLNGYRINAFPNGPCVVLTFDVRAQIAAMGGTMAMLAMQGIPVKLVVQTPPPSDNAFTTAQTREACRILGIDAPVFVSAPHIKSDLRTFVGKTSKLILEEMHARTVFAPSFFPAADNNQTISGTLMLYEVLLRTGYKGRLFAPERLESKINCLVDISHVAGKKRDILLSLEKAFESDVSKDLWNGNLEKKLFPFLPEEVEVTESFMTLDGADHHSESLERASVKCASMNQLELILGQEQILKRMEQLEYWAAGLSVQVKSYENEVNRIMRSFSWKVTSPLRVVKQIWAGRYGPGDNRVVKAFAIAKKEGIRQAFNRGMARLSLRRQYRKYHMEGGRVERYCESLSYRPLISVVVSVFNPEPKHLKECLESVVQQAYANWELCIADDASSDSDIRAILLEYGHQFPDKVKVVFRKENGHICAATNSAMALAEGEYVAFLDHDDLLTQDALLEVAVLLNKHADADMIYSDEDKMDSKGVFSEPYFKPEWAPEMFMGQMYTCHLAVYRRSVISKVGGLREGYEGAQDYDLLLRVSEVTDKIYHIPRILYHWRKSPMSTSQVPASKEYAFEASLRSINDALSRRQERGWAERVESFPGCYLVHYSLKDMPLISIVILTRDNAHLLDRCLFSILTRSPTENYEIILVDNGSRKDTTFRIFEKWKKILGKRLRIERHDIPFNFSKLNNRGVEKTRGDLVLLLNNDTEVITDFWLKEMAGYAKRDEIGAVGALLLYPDHTIQHGGVVLGITGTPGMRGVAGHSHKGIHVDNGGYFGRLRIVSNYSAVTGACLMVEKRLYEEVGGLDESLGVAFNDVDFCLRLRDNQYRNVVLPHVRLFHHESKSRGYEDIPEKQKRFAGEIEVMLERWDKALENDPYYSPHLTLWHEDFSMKSRKEMRLCSSNH